MGLIIGVAVVLVLLGALLYLVDKGARSRWLRPYLGVALIGLLIAGMGLLLGLVSEEIEGYFLFVAKAVIAITGVLLCLRLIGLVAKRYIVRP